MTLQCRLAEFPCAGTVADCVICRDHVIVRYEDVFRVYDPRTGSVVNVFPTQCRHTLGLWLDVPRDQGHVTESSHVSKTGSHVIEACQKCRLVRIYQVDSGHCCVVYRGDSRLCSMCAGPAGTVLVRTHGTILQLQWNAQQTALEVARRLTSTSFTGKMFRMHYVEAFGHVAISGGAAMLQVVMAVNLHDGAEIWREKESSDPRGMTSDPDGRLFVADGVNNRLRVLDAKSGAPIQEPWKFGSPICNALWISESRLLVIDHGNKMSVWSIL